VTEGGSLQTGDRLQARLSTTVDCDLYAFLYDSEGAVTDVFASQFVYSGRLQYGPGQEEWVTLGETDRVYTLYVVAATRLAEDKTEWWERLSELREQGQVERFEGLPLQDQTLAELVGREAGADSTLAVLRGDAATRSGKSEEVILTDGTRLQVRPQIIGGRGAAIRAVSFVTQ
jgi:hypothetical protein